MRTIAVATVVAAMTWTITAHADWQYTRWGMTPEQAMAASKEQLKQCEKQNCRGQTTADEAAQLFGNYRSGEFNFTAFIYFDKRTNKLSSVRLLLEAPKNANSLIGALRKKYGEPASYSRTEIMALFVWRDQTDQISLVEIGSGPSAHVSINYQPRVNESSKGL